MPIEIMPKLDFCEQMKEVCRSTARASLALLLPVIILCAIYGGIATPTEAACVAIFYVIPVSMFIYKTLGPKQLADAFVKGATTTVVLIIMFFFVMINTRIMTMEQLPQEMANCIITISPNKYVILLIVNLFLLGIGMVMDDIRERSSPPRYSSR